MPVVIQRSIRALCLLLLIVSGSAPAAYPINGTFLDFYRNLTPALWALEFRYMQEDDINTVVIVSVGHLEASTTQPLSCTLGSDSYTDDSGYSLAPEGLLYPSAFINPAQQPTTDLLEMVLELADSMGMNVYLGSLQTAADWSSGTEFCALRSYNQEVAAEVLQRYGHHPSLKGWYFTQEVWMNWVKYYGQQNGEAANGYYGTNLMAQWDADMKNLDSTKLTSAAIVVKKTGTGAMPSLTSTELQFWTTGFLKATKLDVFMPQDGAGAGAGAPSLSDLPAYFGAMAAAVPAAGTKTTLWSTLETFTAPANPDVSSEQYPPVSNIARVQTQVSAVAPFVNGYVSWMFGDDMSPQATYYPVEADELNRKYRYTFNPQTIPNDDLLTIRSYWYPGQQPSLNYPDSTTTPLLSDGTGGGYNGNSLATWVGFSDPSSAAASVQVIADLGSSQVIHSVRALTQSWMNAGILHPAQMRVEVSQDGANWMPFGTTRSFPLDTQNFAVMWGEIDASASGRYVRWTFNFTQWMFLAELEVIGPQ